MFSWMPVTGIHEDMPHGCTRRSQIAETQIDSQPDDVVVSSMRKPIDDIGSSCSKRPTWERDWRGVELSLCRQPPSSAAVSTVAGSTGRPSCADGKLKTVSYIIRCETRLRSNAVPLL